MRPFEVFHKALYNLHNLATWALILYNNGMMGAQFEIESPCATFLASDYYILRAHNTRVEP
jgi:hypothetical protein